MDKVASSSYIIIINCNSRNDNWNCTCIIIRSSARKGNGTIIATIIIIRKLGHSNSISNNSSRGNLNFIARIINSSRSHSNLISIRTSTNSSIKRRNSHNRTQLTGSLT